MRFDKLMQFEEKSNDKEMKHFTVEAEICEYIKKAGNFYSDETPRTRLRWFKQCMYYCSSGFNNQMFLSIAQDSLSLSEDILNIHRLMYQFMCSEKHGYLKFDKIENIKSNYENVSFVWHVPYILMPYLVAYIMASVVPKNKTISIDSFFNNLDCHFHADIENTNNCSALFDINLDETYHDWTNEYLGREYFSTLDMLYKRYTKTTEQKATVRNSIRGLTCILIECPERPNMIQTYVNSLLNQYKKELSEKERTSNAKADNLPPKDLTSFYPHQESWKEEWEQKFIKSLCNELSETTRKLLIFIGDYLRNNNNTPKYALSVKDFNDFNKQYSSYSDKLLYMLEHLDQVMSNFFKFITEERPDVRQYIKDYKLFFDQKNADRHIKILCKTISKYYEQIQTELRKFVKKVEKSSSSTPENYTTLIPNHDYFNDLKESIQLAQKHLSENLKKEMEQLTPVLKYNNPGYIEALKYPIYHYEEEDILKIMQILNKEYFHLSDDDMKKLIKHKEWNFPTIRPLVIKFLLELPLIVQT